MNVGLGRDDIRALLDDLSQELAARGARADLFLVGGAAIAVAYDEARATRDLDAVFLPADVVRDAAAAVAERRGLAVDWLNDAVKGFLPGPDTDASRFYESDWLNVDVASARYLLAMKLFAARVENDAEDIAFLYRQLGFTTVEEGLDLVESVYHGPDAGPDAALRSPRLLVTGRTLPIRSGKSRACAHGGGKGFAATAQRPFSRCPPAPVVASSTGTGP